MFAGLHVMLAARGAPELVITEQEAKDFMGAAQNVLRHYSVKTTQKTLDWLMFIGVAGGIYGPRLMAVSIRQAEDRRAKGGPARRGQVLPFPSMASSGGPPQASPAAEAAIPEVIAPNPPPEFDPAA